MIRSFIAVDIEPEIAEKLWKVAEMLRKPGIKPVEKENFHITLKFLGNVHSKTLDKMAEEISETIRLKQFLLEISGIGAFPTEKNPRVIWAGTGEGGDKLKELAKVIDEIAYKFGFKRESKPFVPHATIARVKRISGFHKKEIMEIIRNNSGTYFGDFMVNKIKIKKSILTPRGPIYEDLHVIRFGEDQ